MPTLTRRNLIRLAALLPAGAAFSRFRALAAPNANRVKITRIQAMALKEIAGNCLVKIDTDAGITGYGEAGLSGPMMRARLEQFRPRLVGQDPLAIEKHFLDLTSLMHPYMANIPAVSGVDMALWDIAGKITGLPVTTLLGGPFRDAIQMYSHGIGVNLLDPISCRDWAQRIKQMPEGFSAFKIGIDQPLGVPAGRYAFTLDSDQIRNVARGFMNAREAVGTDIDIAVHCHNELDARSAIAAARAVEPVNPLFLEDPLAVPFSEAWMSLRRSTRVPILTGEKLELVNGFRPFLDHQAVDIIHPDLAFTGGLTGAKKIADYAMLTRTPVALHNVGSLVLTFANAQFGSAIHNFFRSESALGRPTRHVEQMAASNPPEVKNSRLKVPSAPGLGFDPNLDYLKKVLAPGEPFWE